MNIFLITALSIFLAEIGDRTQIMTMALVLDKKVPAPIFAGAIVGFGLAILISVILTTSFAHFIDIHLLRRIGGIMFIAFGLLTLWGKF